MSKKKTVPEGGGEKHEMGRWVELIVEHEAALQVIMVAPVILMALYILFVEQGKLFWSV